MRRMNSGARRRPPRPVQSEQLSRKFLKIAKHQIYRDLPTPSPPKAKLLPFWGLSAKKVISFLLPLKMPIMMLCLYLKLRWKHSAQIVAAVVPRWHRAADFPFPANSLRVSWLMHGSEHTPINENLF